MTHGQEIERRLGKFVQQLATLEDIEAVYRKLQPTDSPDVYVMTTAAFRAVRDEVMKDSPTQQEFDAVAMFGIPIEHYVTLDEVFQRCCELRDAGKKVGMVSE